MSMDDQGTKCRRNITENFNRLSRAHERYRRQTDGRAIAYSEREREFTFAKKLERKWIFQYGFPKKCAESIPLTDTFT